METGNRTNKMMCSFEKYVSVPREKKAKWTLFSGRNTQCCSSSAWALDQHWRKTNERIQVGHQSYNSGLHVESKWHLGSSRNSLVLWCLDQVIVFCSGLVINWLHDLKKGFFFWFSMSDGPSDHSHVCFVRLDLNSVIQLKYLAVAEALGVSKWYVTGQIIRRNTFSDKSRAEHCLFMSSLCKVMKTKSVGLAGVTTEHNNWSSWWIDFAVLNWVSLWPYKYAVKFSYDETFRSCFDESWEGSSQPISEPFPWVSSSPAGLVSQLLAESRIYIHTVWLQMPLENMPQIHA